MRAGVPDPLRRYGGMSRSFASLTLDDGLHRCAPCRHRSTFAYPERQRRLASSARGDNPRDSGTGSGYADSVSLPRAAGGAGFICRLSGHLSVAGRKSSFCRHGGRIREPLRGLSRFYSTYSSYSRIKLPVSAPWAEENSCSPTNRRSVFRAKSLPAGAHQSLRAGRSS